MTSASFEAKRPAAFVNRALETASALLAAFCEAGSAALLGGSWDLVTRVIIKVTMLISTYNPS